MTASRLLFFAILFMGSFANAQSINKTEPQQFWDTHILAILDKDVERVIDQSIFPMETFEGEWSKKDFRDAFDIIFDATTLEALGNQSYRDIDSYDDGDGLVYTVVISTSTEIDGELYESALILSFSKFDKDWKLFKIDVAG